YGVRFSTGKLRAVADESVTVSVVSIVLTGAVATAVGAFLGLNNFEIIVFSAAAAFSSSLVGLELIKDDLRKELVHSRLVESMQLIQDLFAVLLILLVFSTHPFSAMLKGLLVLAAAMIFKVFFPRIAETFRDSTEVVMVFSLSTLAVFVSITQVLDISIVIGAFAAGLALSKYPYSLEIVDTVGSLKDFFTAILFVSIGSLAATLNPQVFLLSGIIAAITLFIKPFTIYSALRSLGKDSRVSFLSSLGLDQVSEFATIIAIQAFIAGKIGEPMLQSVVLATAFTMALSTYTARHEHGLYRKFSRLFHVPEQAETNVENPENHAILVGYDTQGRKILEKIVEEEKEVVVIEYDPEKLEELKEKEVDYVFGDVMHQRSWGEANYTEADIIVSTVPLRHVSDRIIALETEADKILRAPNSEQAQQLLEEGATFVSVPKVLSSQRLIEHLKGIFNNPNYREELRRKNLLELRKQQSQ
ncbi:MAG: cation:proton antiporter, partial [Candidatus Nanohalobium sp.]